MDKDTEDLIAKLEDLHERAFHNDHRVSMPIMGRYYEELSKAFPLLVSLLREQDREITILTKLLKDAFQR